MEPCIQRSQLGSLLEKLPFLYFRHWVRQGEVNIAKLEESFPRADHILRFDVTMNDPVDFELFQSVEQLLS